MDCIQYQRYVYNINVVLLCALLLKNHKRKQPRKFWVRNIFKQRKQQSDYYNLLEEMRLTDTEKYFNYLRMSSSTFNKLLNILGPKLIKIDYVREVISPEERLALTLRYLASGDSMVSISYAFRVGASTVSQIIKETCIAIWDCLSKLVLLTPSENSWKKIANEFERKWQLPHCIGAIDGKHVVIQAPPKAGSTFFNYKGSHSIVLLALCDANYKFTLVDIGAQGRHSDGGILNNSSIGRSLKNNALQIPAAAALEYGEEPLHYYIVGDEAFPLSINIMRPYPGRFLSQNKRIFNYRLSRGRRVIENVFGILAARWRIYRKPIISSLSTAEGIIKATVCLHNFLMVYESKTSNSSKCYCSTTFFDRENMDGELVNGEWRNEEGANNLLPINRVSSNMYGQAAGIMRDQLTSYFLFNGAVPFQLNKI